MSLLRLTIVESVKVVCYLFTCVKQKGEVFEVDILRARGKNCLRSKFIFCAAAAK